MSFLHDVIKINFINIGYLPNTPYHLISDAEMFDAFLRDDGFFADFYPCPSESLEVAYAALKECIVDKINAHLYDPNVPVPDWVYSYMLLRPITFDSSEADIAYLYELLGIPNIQGVYEFNAQVAEACYLHSIDWLKRVPSRHYDRPPTMFGETHVTKSLRLDQANIFIDEGIT